MSIPIAFTHSETDTDRIPAQFEWSSLVQPVLGKADTTTLSDRRPCECHGLQTSIGLLSSGEYAGYQLASDTDCSSLYSSAGWVPNSSWRTGQHVRDDQVRREFCDDLVTVSNRNIASSDLRKYLKHP